MVRVVEATARHLGTGKRQPIPDEECGAEPLGDAIVARFAQTWYLPPLRRRLSDVLAPLHFYGSRVFPREGPTARAVDSDLLHQLLLDRSRIATPSPVQVRHDAEHGRDRRAEQHALSG